MKRIWISVTDKQSNLLLRMAKDSKRSKKGLVEFVVSEYIRLNADKLPK